jgi:hypothetical protein
VPETKNLPFFDADKQVNNPNFNFAHLFADVKYMSVVWSNVLDVLRTGGSEFHAKTPPSKTQQINFSN